MIKITVLFFLLIFFCSGALKSQNPQYVLNATNFSYFQNKIEFDIYISQLNAPVYFEYAGGQYYFNFNPSIANGGTLSYSIIGSDLPAALRPRGPQVYNSQLRLAINSFPGASLGYDMTNNGSPGTKIVRMRLQTSAATLSSEPLNLSWRNPPVPPAINPVTKIYSYVDNVNTQITTPENHLIGGMNSTPELVSPQNNSIDNDLTLTFVWRKVINALSYRLLISTDSLFNNIVRNDSVYSDTSKIISGLNNRTDYYFKVNATNGFASTAYSLHWKFKTRDVLKLKLTALMEGLYYPIFNLMQRKDTLKIYLAQNSPPYNFVDSAISLIDTITFKGFYKFNFAAPGNFYLVAKHFNSLSTWSKSGGENLVSTDTNSYNFTTAISQAYGNNMQLKGGKATFYAGDINYSGTIDGLDLIRIHSDSFLFVTGEYLNTDLTGDGIVDAIDYSIGDNNGVNYVAEITP